MTASLFQIFNVYPTSKSCQDRRGDLAPARLRTLRGCQRSSSPILRVQNTKRHGDALVFLRFRKSGNPPMNQTVLPRTVNWKLLPLRTVVTAFGFALLSWSAQSPFVTPPTPLPVAPPPGNMTVMSPMVSLSATQNYSASRVSSYQREGGTRDNFWIPSDGSEVTLAEITGPGAITHIWTVLRRLNQQVVAI
jgi:hypothetical protein